MDIKFILAHNFSTKNCFLIIPFGSCVYGMEKTSARYIIDFYFTISFSLFYTFCKPKMNKISLLNLFFIFLEYVEGHLCWIANKLWWNLIMNKKRYFWYIRRAIDRYSFIARYYVRQPSRRNFIGKSINASSEHGYGNVKVIDFLKV